MNRQQRGFTLIESLTALAVAASVVMSAMPAMSHLLGKSRLQTAALEMRLAMDLARSEAVARGHRVAIEPLGSTPWTEGWQVFSDLNNDGRRDEAEPVLRVFTPEASGLQIETRGLPRGGLSYDETGFVRRSGSSGLVLGRMVISYQGQSRTICIAAARTRLVDGIGC